VDAEQPAVDDLDRSEPGLLELSDKVTLRQRAGCSTDPCRRMRQHFRRRFVLVNGQVGDAESPGGAEDAGAFCERARLARREAEDGVRNDLVDAIVWERDALHLPLTRLDV